MRVFGVPANHFDWHVIQSSQIEGVAQIVFYTTLSCFGILQEGTLEFLLVTYWPRIRMPLPSTCSKVWLLGLVARLSLCQLMPCEAELRLGPALRLDRRPTGLQVHTGVCGSVGDGRHNYKT